MPTIFMLAPVAAYSSEIQQPMRATAIMDGHQRTHKAASFAREQGRAASLHPDAQPGFGNVEGASLRPQDQRTIAINLSTRRIPLVSDQPQSWQNYEQVAVEIMNRIAALLGLERSRLGLQPSRQQAPSTIGL